jgi:hypothetical protein
MLNWCKQRRKIIKVGALKEERVEKFRKILEMTE